MKGALKIAKGRVEEATGALIGSNKLRSEGLMDQSVGRAQKAADASLQKTKQMLKKVKNNVDNFTKKS